MRAVWAILGGVTLGAGLAWWLARDQPTGPSPEARQRAATAATAHSQDAVPPLYRWRDADGTLQITDTPPKGRPFERIARDPAPGIQVDASR